MFASYVVPLVLSLVGLAVAYARPPPPPWSSGDPVSAVSAEVPVSSVAPAPFPLPQPAAAAAAAAAAPEPASAPPRPASLFARGGVTHATPRDPSKSSAVASSLLSRYGYSNDPNIAFASDQRPFEGQDELAVLAARPRGAVRSVPSLVTPGLSSEAAVADAHRARDAGARRPRAIPVRPDQTARPPPDRVEPRQRLHNDPDYSPLATRGREPTGGPVVDPPSRPERGELARAIVGAELKVRRGVVPSEGGTDPLRDSERAVSILARRADTTRRALAPTTTLAGSATEERSMPLLQAGKRDFARAETNRSRLQAVEDGEGDGERYDTRDRGHAAVSWAGRHVAADDSSRGEEDGGSRAQSERVGRPAATAGRSGGDGRDEGGVGRPENDARGGFAVNRTAPGARESVELLYLSAD